MDIYLIMNLLLPLQDYIPMISSLQYIPVNIPILAMLLPCHLCGQLGLQAIINQKIELVLTAHPTEAQRRSALKKHEQMLQQMKAP